MKEAGLTNAQRLRNELGDLLIIADLLKDSNQLGDFSEEEFEEAREKKIAKLNKYLAFARSLGAMDGEWTV